MRTGYSFLHRSQGSGGVPMTHGSLFSGIGGFDLAAAWAGWTNVFNCEIDPFCRRVLKYHFPESEQYEDIRTTDFTVWRDRVDVLTGGSASRANARVRPTTATSGPQCSELFGLFDRAGSWARTFSESLIGRREWFSSRCALIWRRQDTRCKRTLYQLRASVLPICDTEHGLLPTVVTQGLKVHGKSGSEPLSPAMLPTPVASDCGSGRVNKSLSKGATARPTLALAARMGLLSTPTISVGLLPTPMAADCGVKSTGTERQDSLTKRARQMTGETSLLNPLYVEEMMGYPSGWTMKPFAELSDAGAPSLPGAASRSKPTATP